MDGHCGGRSSRRSVSGRKKAPDNGSADAVGRTSITRSPCVSCPFFLSREHIGSNLSALGILIGDRNVRGIRLSKSLTLPENSTGHEACRRMAAQRVDAVLLTDSNALLCGILTDKVSFAENGKFRHLPIVENGEVIGLLDIATCLYDAIARMEREAVNGKAIAAAVQGVEKHWGSSFYGLATFIETPQEWIFRPCLSTIIQENSKFFTVSATDSVLTATKKMLELKKISAVVTIENKLQGIFTYFNASNCKNVSPELTPVKNGCLEVMTPIPECGTMDTPIVDALHTMHDRKFLHLPVVDRGGKQDSISVKDLHKLLQIQKDTSAFCPLSDLSTSFGFKLEDKQQRMHRFNCETHSLADLITCILQRVGYDVDRNHLPQILYEDEDHDKVIVASDSDLVAAVDHARQSGWKSLRLHLDYSGLGRQKKGHGSGDLHRVCRYGCMGSCIQFGCSRCS
ncbi:hypothetical protein OPV22_021380 [Ensete ventricosum]|uniref:CBS domain-containing protein n=1 Tax=Ensete ventricosum TaxID=4639 RepID=A0AAV8QMA9_ENSVE|nr:hypothetical protein OPV22_021380 [Ensete ventricosum]